MYMHAEKILALHRLLSRIKFLLNIIFFFSSVSFFIRAQYNRIFKIIKFGKSNSYIHSTQKNSCKHINKNSRNFLRQIWEFKTFLFQRRIEESMVKIDSQRAEARPGMRSFSRVPLSSRWFWNEFREERQRICNDGEVERGARKGY